MIQKTQEIVEKISGTSAVSVGVGTTIGANTGFLSGLQTWGGLCVALVGLLISWYYKHKRFKMEEKEHEARVKKNKG